jgi:heme-degrading monooxygenase HmoA
VKGRAAPIDEHHNRETPMILTVFRARLRPDADMAAAAVVNERMHELAIAMPGFVSYKDYAAPDGENVTVVEFASEAEQLAWRNQPEHREAQERGRREFFAAYKIQVCRVERSYDFSTEQGRRESR